LWIAHSALMSQSSIPGIGPGCSLTTEGKK